MLSHAGANPRSPDTALHSHASLLGFVEGPGQPTLPSPGSVFATLPLESPPPLPVRDEANFHAAGLQSCFPFWRDVMLPAVALPSKVDRMVTSWVDPQGGVRIEHFMDSRSPAYPPRIRRRNHPIAIGDRQWVTEELARCLLSGAISVASPDDVAAILSLGVVWNHGKRRLIFDGRPLNEYTPSPDGMTYMTLRQFQAGLRHRDWLFSLDHKSGYHHVHIHPSSRKYFGIQWNGVTYVYNVMPFGWAPACYVYDTLSSVVSAYLAKLCIHNIHYLDDFGCSVPADTTPLQRRWLIWVVVAVMYLAGYTVSLTKSNLVASTSITLLGFGIDTVACAFFVPEKKVVSLLDLVTEVLGPDSAPNLSVPVVKLMSLVGKAQSMALAAPPIPIFLRSSHICLATHGAHRNTVPISRSMRKDLKELSQLREWTRLSKWPSEIHARLSLWTDAALDGWGATLISEKGHLDFSGRFPLLHQPRLIHTKELLAVRYAISAIRNTLKDCFLDIFTDNTIVQNTLLKGNSLDATSRAFARVLLRWQLDSGVHVRVNRVDTVSNARSDGLSRDPLPLLRPPKGAQLDRSDHRLNPDFFYALQYRCGRDFTIDACANVYNRQCERYISLDDTPSDPPVAINIFSFTFPPFPDGSSEFVYCNPPWGILHRVWNHFRERRCTGVMIVPDIPTKPWYGSVLREATRVERIARAGSEDVFFQASRGYRASVGPVPWNVLALHFDFSLRSATP